MRQGASGVEGMKSMSIFWLDLLVLMMVEIYCVYGFILRG